MWVIMRMRMRMRMRMCVVVRAIRAIPAQRANHESGPQQHHQCSGADREPLNDPLGHEELADQQRRRSEDEHAGGVGCRHGDPQGGGMSHRPL